MTPARLLGLIENLPDGLTEIYLHPATGPYRGLGAGLSLCRGTGGPGRAAGGGRPPAILP